MRTIQLDQDRCILCGSCIDVCVRRIYEESDDMINITDPSLCIFCGHCMAICPEDAIRLPVVNPEEFKPLPARNELPRPEQLMDLFRFRRSVRRFKNRPVEREKIEKIIEAGRFAPTGGNFQPFRFTVIQTPERISNIRNLIIDNLVKQADRTEEELSEKLKRGESLTQSETIEKNYAGNMRAMADPNKKGVDRLLWNAPVLIALYVPPAVTSPGVDAGLTGMQMALMAETLGLGTCFIGFVPGAAAVLPDLRRAMQVPEDHTVALAFIAGYPDFEYLRFVSRKPARIKWL